MKADDFLFIFGAELRSNPYLSEACKTALNIVLVDNSAPATQVKVTIPKTPATDFTFGKTWGSGAPSKDVVEEPESTKDLEIATLLDHKVTPIVEQKEEEKFKLRNDVNMHDFKFIKIDMGTHTPKTYYTALFEYNKKEMFRVKDYLKNLYSMNLLLRTINSSMGTNYSKRTLIRYAENYAPELLDPEHA